MSSVATLTELTLVQRRELLKMARARDLVRDRAELPPIEPVAREGRLPLSSAQQRLWFVEQLGSVGPAYHMHRPLRLRGELDRAALVRALDGVVARHEVLRTVFTEVDGVPEQRIAPAEASRFHLVEHDLSGDADAGLDRITLEEARAPFDLERGPLIRGRLVRLAADDHVLLLTMHHIISDGWSLGVLTRELSALYAAHREGREADLPGLPVQYADYAAWQRRWAEGEVLREQADYWRGALSGVPELLELPTDRPRPAQMDHAGASLRVELDEALTAGLKALSQRHGTTLFMTVLAAWGVVLSRLSGQADVVVGTPSANRGRREIEGLIGFFVNTLALRVDLSDAPTVAGLLGRVKARALEAQHNQDIPFEQVVELVQPARSLAYTPLFQVTFAWRNAPVGALELPGVKLTPADAASHVTAKFDLLLSVGEAGGRIAGEMEYATALFDKATVERWMGYLRRVLEAMAADDALCVDRLPMLSGAERRLVLREFNETRREYPHEACVHELFERQVERAPDAEAIVFGDVRWSYAELNARANRLAHHLCALGVRPDVRVAICVERGPEMVAAVLAVLKAGGAYVPLDPSYPVERLRYMLADGAPAVVLTQDAVAETLADVFAGLDADVPVLRLDAPARPWASRADTNPVRGALAPEHPAYVIYTSGSTGRPKGVLVPHRGLCNVAAAQQRAFGVGPGDRVLQFASLSFDAAAFELVMALASGAALCVAPREELIPGPDLLALLRRHAVTTVTLPPSALAALPVEELPALRTITTAGEALPAELAARWGARHRLWNLYGPTEATIWSTAAECADPTRTPDIGHPIDNTRAYVLDAALEPLPAGVAGELYLGGAGVARGYLGRPGLTAERFVPDPFGGEPGARLYRTGDRVRRLADGRLDFIGRMDHQVKVRGFRIEPGEVEARLAEHPAVREAIVLVREDAPGDRRLVAYVVAEVPAGADVLRAHLSERLPEYMVPAAYVRLDALPLTPNGKVDRKALPAPEGDAYAARGYEAPLGQTEEVLAGIWSEVLRVERVGRHDDFFALGGHSLLAVQVISRVRQVLQADVALGELFARPALADFARALDAAARAELPPIEPAAREGRLPLSFAQQRLWFLEQLGGLGGTYHMPMRRRLRGTLDRGALARALDGIVARHEALRTVFALVDGVPEQRIAPADAGFHLVEHDLDGRADAEAELGRLMAGEASAPFDLERGPLIRGRLIRLAADDHVLLLTMHHIVSDGWSVGVLTEELSALYAAHARGAEAALPALPVQYADYAAWQRRWVEGEVLREQAEYWTRTLAGAPELLELPTDRPRPPEQDHAGARVGVELDEALTAGLTALSRRHGTTLFMTLMAGWATVLGRLSGQDDVVIGTPSANRGRREIEGLIGFFLGTLPLRVDLCGAPTVAELLGRVRARALEAQQHQDIPFEQVVELADPVRSMAYTPLFQVMFTWQNAPRERLELPGLQVIPQPAASTGGAKFDLSLALGEREGRITGGVSYATALFDRETVERWMGYFRRVLEEMVADESRRVERLPLIAADERARVVHEWNRTDAAYPAGSCIHELFEQQAARTPDAAAVVWEGGTLTYGELNARANRLAHHLRATGVGPGVRVGLCVERSPAMVEGILGVLKAGGVFVPLDPGYPADRLAYMLADSAPALVLAQKHVRDRIHTDVPVLELDAASPAWAGLPAANPERGALTPAHPAYVTYTSGSTGRPKGVPAVHHRVLNLIHWYGRELAIGERDAVLLVMSFSFDGTYRNLFAPLFAGAQLHLAAEPFDPARIVAQIAAHPIRLVNLTPSAFQALRAADGEGALARLRTVVLVGEPVQPRALLEMPEPRPEFVNLYGPTECSGITTYHRLSRDLARYLERPVPVGRPIPNSRIYVLDAAGTPAPVGVAGELHVGGTPVGIGYQNRPDQTAERFVADPFSAQPGARLYRTGDRARWRADGTLEFMGRMDSQVKVRGYRIEPGEIEARLAEHAAVREAVVLVREDVPGEKRLVAYWVGDAAEAETLRAHLGQALPPYMVPSAYVRMEAWPLTPNRKLDRRALPAPEGDAWATRGYEAPVGDTEQALAGIWAEVLRVERVGRWDGFFDLGGHSLLAVQVISRVRQALRVEVGLGELFTWPVLADFARELRTAAPAELPPIQPAPRQGPIPLSFAQQRLWFLEQLRDLGGTYHIHAGRRLRGALDGAALARALDDVVARHEALRTTFAQVDGVPEQRIAPADAGFALARHDLAGRADADAALQALMAEEARAPFDLEHGPLIRGRLVRLAADDHVLLLTMHHIVSDAWSMGVFFGELSALYAAHREGGEAHLPAPPVQYPDYAVWQRRWVEGEVLQAQADYWTGALAGAPGLLELPTDRPRPAQMDPAGASLRVELDAELTAGLKALSRRQGTTLYMTLLAGWAAVLGRLSGQDDVVIGSPVAGRGRQELEGLIGFFVNTLALRVDLSGAPTVAELLGRVRERALQAQQHQDIPFEQVVELVDPARSLSHSPLFQVVLAWQNTPLGAGMSLPGLELDAVATGASQAQAKFDLSLNLREAGDGIAGEVTYSTALFDRATVERYLGYLRRVLAEMAADERRPVERLALMSGDERAGVLDAWNRRTAEYASESCIHELFERQVERAPDAEAVVFGDARWSYAELNARANRLAHHLRALGVRPDVRVGICVERGPEMVAAVLAVLKAGGAYVPLDPSYPVDRLRYMLADGAPAVVLTQDAVAETLADLFAGVGADVPVLRLDGSARPWASRADTNPVRGALAPEHPAYVIYTSGSTGRPKGVLVPHRGLCNVAAAQQRAFGVGAGDRVLQFASLSFDAAAFELVMALASGAALCVASREELLPGPDLLALLRRHAVTTVTLPPSALAALPVEELPALRTITTAGEALPAELVGRWGVRHRLWNLYGPTEATIWSTVSECADPARTPDIGHPIANTRAYVLDAALEPLPAGVAGELYLGGAGVARGYLGRPGLTAERFVPDPFGGEPGARLYRTGDRVRRRADGMLDFIGRMDHQVKVRGFRIEPGEVEARLREHPAVREAVVLVREDAPGDRRLVAYVVADEPAGAEVLRAHLGQALPAYMVPAAFVRLETLPLTPNGKIDRKALPAPDGEAFAAQAYEAPVGEIEETLAGIWAELLRVERVGRHDDFFALGGHSLLAVQVVSRVRRVMEVELALGDVFELSELSALADRILDLQLVRFDPETLARLAELVRGPGAEHPA